MAAVFIEHMSCELPCVVRGVIDIIPKVRILSKKHRTSLSLRRPPPVSIAAHTLTNKRLIYVTPKSQR